MTILTSTTSTLIDDDTAARAALAAAGVSGDPGVAIGIRVFGSAARFLSAVHDHRDNTAPLTALARERIRRLATGRAALDVLENTTRRDSTLLTPLRAGWPEQVNAMLSAAPVALWVEGDARVLSGPTIGLSSAAAPTDLQKQSLIEVTTGLCARGWTLVTSASEGSDRLALRCADMMKCASVTVVADALAGTDDDGRRVLVSEVAPGCEATGASRRRVRHLVVALGRKVITDDVTIAASGGAVLDAAQAMGRPVGVFPTTGHGTDVEGERSNVSIIRSIRDADLFH